MRFTSSEQEQFLHAIDQIIDWKAGEVRIIQKMKGSIRYRFTLEAEQAARLLLAVQTGELDHFKINDVAIERIGSKVFIGHGRSPLWRELKDFISERLQLEWDEFNREPTSGLTTSERLHDMLGEAMIAILIMTSEDEHADKSLHARENVIHEVGLFQGKLGKRKVIILLEDGCKEFSNIFGLCQIHFPKGNISNCFDELRRVLERETVVETSALIN